MSSAAKTEDFQRTSRTCSTFLGLPGLPLDFLDFLGLDFLDFPGLESLE
jgi:hypothetical protein